MNWLEQLMLNEQDSAIMFAFLLAGVEDIHAAQDNLSEVQWDRAKVIYETLLKCLDSK